MTRKLQTVATVKEIEKAIKAKVPGRWRVDRALYLQVSQCGAPSWIVRFQRAGKPLPCGQLGAAVGAFAQMVLHPALSGLVFTQSAGGC